MIRLITVICAALALTFASASMALATDTPPHVDTSGANKMPIYPSTAFVRMESGSVIVGARVDTNGKVGALRLLRSSGYDDLDTAAMNSVRGWKFVPGTENGSPTDGWATVQSQFAPPQ